MTRQTHNKRTQRATCLFVESLEPRRLLSATRNAFSPADISTAANNSRQDRETSFVRSLNNEESRLNNNRLKSSQDQNRTQENSREAPNEFPSRTDQSSSNRIRSSRDSENTSNGTGRQPLQLFSSAASLGINTNSNSQSQQRTLLQNEVILIERGSGEPSIATRIAPQTTGSFNVGLPATVTVSFSEGDDSTSRTVFARSRPNTTNVLPPTFMASNTEETINADDDEEEFLQPTHSEFDALGGLINLDQMPKLVDTLPATGENMSSLEWSDIPNVETKGNEDKPGQITTLEKSSKGRVAENAPTEYHHELPSSETRSIETEDQNAVDQLFATERFADTMEEFGGIVEMPDELSARNGNTDAISFDSIVPRPPQIDQIISRTPMVEVGDDSQTSPNDEPVSINVRASIPAVLLLIPSLCRRRKHSKVTQQAMDAAARKKVS